MRFCVFVYGTLMRGQANHRGFANAPTKVTPAWLWGRLYDTGCGFPTLEIPNAHFFAAASTDYLADARRCQETFRWATHDFRAAGYSPIWGELLTFEDAPERLPKLDTLEQFTPGKGGLYERVLTVVATLEPQLQTSWVYVFGDQAPDTFRQRRIPMWAGITTAF